MKLDLHCGVSLKRWQGFGLATLLLFPRDRKLRSLFKCASSWPLEFMRHHGDDQDAYQWSLHHQTMWRWWRLIRCIIGSVTALIYSFSSSSLMASNSSGVRKSVLWATRLVFLPCFLLSCLGSNCSPINAFEASGRTESLTERVGQNSASDTHSSATLKKYNVRLIDRFTLHRF